jgi:hypothetical protein
MKVPVLFSGNLTESITVPEVLNFISSTRVRGALTVSIAKEPPHKLTLFVADGKIVSTRVETRTDELLELLVRYDSANLAEISNLAKSGKSGKEICALLLGKRKTTKEKILRQGWQQTLDRLVTLLKARAGQFYFMQLPNLPPNSLRVSISIQELLLEALVLYDEWGQIPHYYQDEDSVFELASNPMEKQIQLTESEWKLLFLLNGRANVKEIWERSPYPSRLDTSKRLYALATARLIQPVVVRTQTDNQQRIGLENIAGQSMSLSGSRSLSSSNSSIHNASEPRQSPMELGTIDVALPFRRNETLLSPSAISVSPKTASIVELSPRAGLSHPIIKPKTLIGRGGESDILLPVDTVSSRHAQIVSEGGNYFILDLGSTNGTRLNGNSITHSPLRHGDIILVSVVRLRFEFAFEVTSTQSFSMAVTTEPQQSGNNRTLSNAEGAELFAQRDLLNKGTS